MGHDSSYKRTRGEDEYRIKRARRRYDDDERSMRDDRLRKRSLSPGDGSTAQREKSHRSRHDAYRRDERHRDSDYAYNHTSESKRDERKSNPAADLNSRSDRRRPARSPSPSSTRHHHTHNHRHHRHRRASIHSTTTPDELPFGSRHLVRSDLNNFRPLLAQYLELQKQKDMTAMDEKEVRGRWKSFLGKWNHGELAEGWYRPETLAEAKQDPTFSRPPPQSPIPNNRRDRTEVSDDEGDGGGSVIFPNQQEKDESDNDSDDDYGPTLPPDDPSYYSSAARLERRGPGIPSLQDLAARREDAEDERQQSVEQLRLARKEDRATQRERLEDLVPRADAGTRERRLEKKREVNDKMRGFRERSAGAGEVNEAEVMGGGDEVAEYKRVQEAAKRRRSEREVRREEEARARAAEREDRVKEYRRKEEETMQVLRRIARERFG